MKYILSFILAGVVGSAIGYAWAWREGLVPIATHGVRVEANKKKIMSMFAHADEIHNHDIQKFLKVSDSSAERYLELLQQEGLITQHGEIGRSVYYTRA